MKKPDFSTLVDAFKSRVLHVRRSLSQNKRQLIILGGSLGLVLILVVGSVLVGIAISRGRSASGVDPDMAPGYSLKGARLLRGLYMPGPAVGETPFPLAFEPDPGYTDGATLKVPNDMRGIDVSELRARRKAELEAIYEALD
jgi:hypothetical protein